jgi:hypothetical protein
VSRGEEKKTEGSQPKQDEDLGGVMNRSTGNKR